MYSIKEKVKEELLKIIEQIDKYSEEEFAYIIYNKYKTNDEYINKNDYANTDKCMKFLKIRSRGKFFQIIRENEIFNHKINNQHIGFYKGDIEDLYLKINGKNKKFY